MNPQSRRSILLGGAILLISLVGYALYEWVLRPRAGFPSDDMGVILGGADTLRVGHWLKFGYAVGVSLLTVGFWQTLRPSLSGDWLALLGSGAVGLFVTSALLGLNILDTAMGYYPQQLSDARSTILVRVVSVSLLQAGTMLTGAILVLGNVGILRLGLLARWFGVVGILLGLGFIYTPFSVSPFDMAAPLLGIAWGVGLVAWGLAPVTKTKPLPSKPAH